MNRLTTLISILAALCVASAQVNERLVPFTPRLSAAKLSDLRSQVEGCNANICFAIDASNAISPAEFTAQKLFILDLVTVFADDTEVEVAAVQYSNRNSVISRLTSDLESFILDVDAATQRGGSGSALRRGISFCTRQLRRRRGEPLKMVLLGDGRSDRPFAAVRRANRFRKLGGDVCVVGAGVTDPEELLLLTGGDGDKVFEVDSFLDVLALQLIIEDMVAQICGV